MVIRKSSVISNIWCSNTPQRSDSTILVTTIFGIARQSLGHIGETPGEALQVVRFTGHSDWPFRAVMLMFSNYRAGTCQVTRCGAFSVIRTNSIGRTEPYCEDSAIGLIPDIITHLGFGKDLSLYLTISL